MVRWPIIETLGRNLAAWLDLAKYQFESRGVTILIFFFLFWRGARRGLIWRRSVGLGELKLFRLGLVAFFAVAWVLVSIIACGWFINSVGDDVQRTLSDGGDHPEVMFVGVIVMPAFWLSVYTGSTGLGVAYGALISLALRLWRTVSTSCHFTSD